MMSPVVLCTVRSYCEQRSSSDLTSLLYRKRRKLSFGRVGEGVRRAGEGRMGDDDDNSFIAHNQTCYSKF